MVRVPGPPSLGSHDTAAFLVVEETEGNCVEAEDCPPDSWCDASSLCYLRPSTYNEYNRCIEREYMTIRRDRYMQKSRRRDGEE